MRAVSFQKRWYKLNLKPYIMLYIPMPMNYCFQKYELSKNNLDKFNMKYPLKWRSLVVDVKFVVPDRKSHEFIMRDTEPRWCKDVKMIDNDVVKVKLNTENLKKMFFSSTKLPLSTNEGLNPISH